MCVYVSVYNFTFVGVPATVEEKPHEAIPQE